MTDRWSNIADSVNLNYVDALEIVSVWSAIRRKHYIVSIVIVCGLLSGFLVPLANSLVYINLQATVTQNINVQKTSRISIDGTLATSNGSLKIPWTSDGNRPYAALVSSTQPNGQFPQWTSDGYAFESYELQGNSLANSTIRSNVSALAPSLDCQSITTSLVDLDAWPGHIYFGFNLTLIADRNDLASAGCKTALVQNVGAGLPVGQSTGDRWTANWVFNTTNAGQVPAAWLNVTDCSDDGSDVRIVANILQPYGKPPPTGNYTLAKVFRVQSLLCRPRYSMGTVTLQTNTTNNDIVALEVQHQSFARVTPELSIPATVLYMNSPLSGDSLDAFDNVGGFEFFKAGTLPIANVESVTRYARYFFSHFGTDPFFSLLNITRDKDTAHYFANSTAFAEDVSVLFANTMAQVANAFGRVNETVPTPGIMTGHESRVFVRQWVLRLMDATLLVLAIVAALCSTVWRPKTCLHEDPNSLAAMAVVLASTKRSDLRSDAWLSAPGAAATPGRDTQVRLSLGATSNPVIVQSEYPSFQNMQTTKSGTARYSPIAVKLGPKFALTGILFLAIAGCLVLQIVQRSRPLLAGTDNAALAWSLVPTVILVLIGYATSAVIDVVCSLATYNKLMRNNARGTDSMTFNARNHSAFAQIFHAIAKLRSRSLLAASFTIIAFPAIKIVAAGLYTPGIAIRSGAINVTLDDSLANNFQKSLNTSEASATELQQRASDFTEWTQIPDFRVPQRAGVLDNLVFANMTDWMAGPNAGGLSAQPGSEVRLRVPAISINATCIPFGPDQFVPYIYMQTDNEFKFIFDCINSTACSQAFNSSDPNVKAHSQVGNSTRVRRYSGLAYLPGDAYYGNIIYDTSKYSVILADFSSVVGPVKNFSAIPDNGTTWADGLLNVSAPTVRGVSCTRTFSAASVEVVFTQTTGTEIGGQDTLLPWSVAYYDRSSVRIEEQLLYKWPLWLAPHSMSRDPYMFGTVTDGRLDSDTLWPERGSSRNFFEVLAAYQHYQVGNLTGLLDVHQLAKATEHLYTTYCAEALTELRYYAQQFGPAAASQTHVPGTLTMRQGVVHQDPGVTIALVSLLFLVFLSLLTIFVRFRSRAVLPEAPGSISAQMSLLLGSRLVERLKEENVRSVADSTIWEQKFGLGWWRLDGEEKLRWGVDVGLLDADLKCKPPPWIEEGEEQWQQ
ncbi:hypothetical protein LTR28_000717 [Elasticomyces elasticus]|nr:hypothetical protein LTR28_000717 [Elasticomyces elasticus]